MVRPRDEENETVSNPRDKGSGMVSGEAFPNQLVNKAIHFNFLKQFYYNFHNRHPF